MVAAAIPLGKVGRSRRDRRNSRLARRASRTLENKFLGDGQYKVQNNRKKPEEVKKPLRGCHFSKTKKHLRKMLRNNIHGQENQAAGLIWSAVLIVAICCWERSRTSSSPRRISWSAGASIPTRTLSPPIRTMVIVIASPILIHSPSRLESTSILIP